MHIQRDGTAIRDNRKEINTCHVSKVIRTVFCIRVSAVKKGESYKGGRIENYLYSYEFRHGNI